MKNRTRAYTRHQRKRAINRKWKILKHQPFYEEGFSQLVLGSLSKGKIHCSCRMCRYEQFHKIPKKKVKTRWDMMLKDMR